MDQARSTISKIFNGEPRSYTRFNLTQNMEGEDSQVEMKLSSDTDEEAVGGNGVVENHKHAPYASSVPYAAHKPAGRTPRSLCFMMAATFLILLIGYLIGYLAHRKKETATCVASTYPVKESITETLVETGSAPLMDWSDVKSLLKGKLSDSSFERTFTEFASDNHRAGSDGDEVLGNKVLNRFRLCKMQTWKDEHFVKLVDLPRSNKVIFKGSELGSMSGFLAYSKTGTAQGGALHGNYGEMDDLNKLQDKNIALDGRVLLVKAGRISFAEKVANAAKLNASAVLIYPDPSDYNGIGGSTQLYGHVHLGSGDPYTPGFPSFNHTQFPPVQSSGLPTIVAQTITADMATRIIGKLGGRNPPSGWTGMMNLGNDSDLVTVEVNNVLADKQVVNVFGVIKGYVDPDRYVVLGAQRDAWGPGFASSTVGTSVLVELARAISDMVKNDGFKPRRSMVFASWSAGEYGSVGATEWLEGYLSSLNMKAFSYINLDRVVSGFKEPKVSASPMMYGLIQSTLDEVNLLSDTKSLYSIIGQKWEDKVIETPRLDDPIYPFIAFSGIPSVSFRFTSSNEYPFFGTLQDTREKLSVATSNQVAKLAVSASQFAGHIALRLVHDHLLRLDVDRYNSEIRSHVVKVYSKFKSLMSAKPQLLPKVMTVQWLMSASGSYSRASRTLSTDILNSNLEDVEMCRIINDRIMRVERDLLSPYVSAREAPFRHILLGSGSHTLKALSEHLDLLRGNNLKADVELFRNQFALATWTIQGCANALAGDIWSMDNMI
ncbi:hypothetical protein DPEC_G00055090 [Dallia pectoralis]|uniref:Uncharacterized protein n=1 Tax=Dallia pectoralis TaxID=75939 RepID=A0ACC2H609_DALPE|nr:hypothetical protein DPEC_G00055090 [Dallia pectoralis]